MTSEREQYLLDRNLRLEHALLVARGVDIAPLPAPIAPARQRPEMPLPPAMRAQVARPIYHRATPLEIARMRSLRRLGRTHAHIADMTGFSATTVGVHTRGVLREREVEA